MATKLKPEQTLQSRTVPQTRRVSRMRSQARAMVVSNQGERSKALICDVSVHGCSLNTEAAWLRMGQFVSLRLSNDWAIQAIVRWVRDDRAGAEFLRPISDADAREISGD